jgi:hypothetical protein
MGAAEEGDAGGAQAASTVWPVCSSTRGRGWVLSCHMYPATRPVLLSGYEPPHNDLLLALHEMHSPPLRRPSLTYKRCTSGRGQPQRAERLHVSVGSLIWPPRAGTMAFQCRQHSFPVQALRPLSAGTTASQCRHDGLPSPHITTCTHCHAWAGGAAPTPA